MARVCLTFDNGPDPRGTPRVLEVLARHGVQATFFVLGRNLAEPWGPTWAERTRTAGHRLGNHSYSHHVPLGDDPRPDAVEQELARTERLLETVWSGPRWFRPFGGGGRLGRHLLSPAAVHYLRSHRYTCVLWNNVPGDWRDPNGWPERALERLRSQEHALLVLHDHVPESLTHLDAFLTRVCDEGHTWTTEFPSACLPIVDGEVRRDLRDLVSGANTSERDTTAT